MNSHASDATRPLFQHAPRLRETVPWLALADLPTPVERLASLEPKLKIGSLWCKRDDVSSEIYGGNKVRSLEFVLAEARVRQAEVVVSYSAVGSNWPLACTLFAARLGFDPVVYYFPYPMDEVKQANLEATRRLARSVHCARSRFTFPFVLFRGLRKLRREHRVYLAPAGGTSTTSTLAFVNAMFELAVQVEGGELPRPDVIFCPLGSGGTLAGLALGGALLDWPTRVVGVRVVDRLVANRWRLDRLIAGTARIVARHGLRPGTPVRYAIEHRFFGAGYSQPHPAGTAAMVTAGTTGLRLDSAYTGKAFAAVLDRAGSGALAGQNVLFWHTLNSRPLR